jgi:hypothetical protein
MRSCGFCGLPPMGMPDYRDEYHERLDFRQQDREGFYQALERNGPKAVREFRDAFG